MSIFKIEENHESEQHSEKRKWLIIAAISLGLYLVFAIVFSFLTYPTTKINGRRYPFKTLTSMFQQIEPYDIELVGRDERTAVVNTKELGIDGQYTEKVSYSQTGFLWPYEIFRNNNIIVEITAQVDGKKMDKVLKSNNLFKDIKKAQDAKIVIQDQKAIVQKEVMGNDLNFDKTTASIINAYEHGNSTIVLKKEYNDPKVYATDLEPKLPALATMAKAKINLTLPDGSIEVLDVTNFLNDSHEYDQVRIREYVDSLKAKYDNVGKERQFVTSGGSEITVSGGIFGILINKPETVALLEQNLVEGNQVNEDLIYSHKSINAGKVKDTYIEISLSDQHMWFYKNGKLVIDTPVVTGTVYSHPTPPGVFEVWIKERNRYLQGPNGDGTRYKVPVSYWMQVDYSGIGLHDTYYRGSYGGSINQWNGSHGCINTPYNAVSTIYDTVDFGTPVVIY